MQQSQGTWCQSHQSRGTAPGYWQVGVNPFGYYANGGPRIPPFANICVNNGVTSPLTRATRSRSGVMQSGKQVQLIVDTYPGRSQPAVSQVNQLQAARRNNVQGHHPPPPPPGPPPKSNQLQAHIGNMNSNWNCNSSNGNSSNDNCNKKDNYNGKRSNDHDGNKSNCNSSPPHKRQRLVRMRRNESKKLALESDTKSNAVDVVEKSVNCNINDKNSKESKIMQEIKLSELHLTLYVIN